MHNLNRDLLVVANKEEINTDELNRTISHLNSLLYHTDSLMSLCTANEVFDLNKYKILTQPQQVAQYIKNKLSTPFIFLSNKN